MNETPALPLDHGATGNGRVLALVAPTARDARFRAWS